jgi:hypothetical protein
MEWAAEQGADVVNMSLGGDDTPGTDPIEAALERLSAAPDGPLFVVAAGNRGPEAGTLGSPGTSPAALTVGAVDKHDAIAAFSSRGPGGGDHGLKPDVTAPGVDIVAARAAGTALDRPVDDHYTMASGTSMATPHVAGAAALLAQQHPGWSGQRIKQALTSSAAGRGGVSAFAQGTGRVDLARAVGQTVVSETSSLSFGLRQWPHHDDQPETKRVVYRNTGTEPVTLDLSVDVTGPDGRPGPEGMFTLDARTVTVPADGTASVGLTADTRPGGDLDGDYSAHVTATGGGQVVRTAAAVLRETESYDLRIEHTGPEGVDGWQYSTTVFDLDRRSTQWLQGDSGSPTATLRVPRGRYVVDTRIHTAGGEEEGPAGTDWIVRPALTVDGATTVAADARTTRPVEVTVPDAGASPSVGSVEYRMDLGDGIALGKSLFADDLGTVRTAHLGPAEPALRTQLNSLWENPSTGGTYVVAAGAEGRMFTGVTRRTTTRDFAVLDVTAGASVPDREGRLQLGPQIHFSPKLLPTREAALPAVRRVHVTGDARWNVLADQLGYLADGSRQMEAYYLAPATAYPAGRRYPLTFNTGVFGPAVGEQDTVFRDGDLLHGSPALFADGAGHTGAWTFDTARTELYRDGELLAAEDGPLSRQEFRLPAEAADYRLTTTQTRGGFTAVSTRVDAAWTFRSARTEGPRAMPVSVVRFTPRLAADSTAPAGAFLTVPVTVQGPAAGRVASLTVAVSTDGGATWQRRPLVNGTHVVVRNPAAGGSVSFRAGLTDQAGNTLDQTIVNAYRVR